ncbi:MAG: hypothetical protein R6X20_18390 [Phycisphaerae bacterium]
MVANFKEARAENCTGAYGPFLQTGHFAEEATFTPRRSGASRTVTISVVYDREADVIEDLVDEQKERLWIFCLRDKSADKGGIARPEVGDRLLRAEDQPDEPWGFAGAVRNETPHGWELLFERNRPKRYGPAG